MEEDRGERQPEVAGDPPPLASCWPLISTSAAAATGWGAEALAYGRGGVSVVSEACAVSHRTVEAGMREVQQASQCPPARPAFGVPAAGKPITEKFPGIKEELGEAGRPRTRGDPQSPLR
ncbi:MAG: hypothetical protein U0587_15570 [Candidatus Binatia bacterium]